MTHVVMPFLRPEPSGFKAEPWHLLGAEGTVPLPGILENWDAAVNLSLQRKVTIDYQRCLTQCQLPDKSPLSMVVEYFSTAAFLSGLAFSCPVIENANITLQASLPGAELGGKLVVKTRLVLAEDVIRDKLCGAFVPRFAGDVLSEDEFVVSLEGDEPRFPVSVVDFASYGFDPDARWAIELPDDPGAAVSAGIRLLLNMLDRDLVEAATRADAPTAAQRRLLETMHDDVARQLVDAALRPSWRAAVQAASENPGTLGESLILLLNNLFSGNSLDAIAALRDADPTVFATSFQGAMQRNRQMRL